MSSQTASLPSNHGARWTEDDYQTVADAVAAGRSTQQIAAAMNRSEGGIAAAASRMLPVELRGSGDAVAALREQLPGLDWRANVTVTRATGQDPATALTDAIKACDKALSRLRKASDQALAAGVTEESLQALTAPLRARTAAALGLSTPQ